MTRTLQGKYADKLEKENKELKQRIIKAIDYIKSNKENTTQKLDFIEMKSYNSALLELLKILGDKENEI